MKVKGTQVIREIILDDGESIFFGRQLEAVKSRTFDVKYPQFKARMLFPVDDTSGPGAETVKYEQYDEIGMAKVVSNYAKDFPRADVKGKEFRNPIKSLGDSFGYNIQEIRAARMAGKPLEQRRASAARKAMIIKEHNIALFGDAKSGLPGFISNANIQQYVTPADGTGVTATWSTKSVAQILRDLTGLVSTVITNTKGVENPTSLLLPLSSRNLISTLQVPNIDKTVLTFFLENNPCVKEMEWLNDLETAGTSSTRRAMVYTRDMEHLWLETPQDFEMFPPQPEGMEFKVYCHQRTGGVIIPYPMAVGYMDGI